MSGRTDAELLTEKLIRTLANLPLENEEGWSKASAVQNLHCYINMARDIERDLA